MTYRFLLLISAILLMGAGVEDKDLKVIQALKQNGSDISKPHAIDFFFDFNQFEQAAPIAQTIDKEGFEVKMYENEDGTFTIEAKKIMVPSPSTMQGLTQKFELLTEKYGGNYDGWGTEIVE